MNGCPPEGDGNNGGAQQGTRHRRFVSAPSTLTSPTPNLSSPLPPQSPSAPRTTLFTSEHLSAPLIMSCHVQSDKKTNKIIVGGCSAVASLHSSLSSISVISIVFVALFLILLLPIQTSCSPLLVKRKSQTNPTPTSSTASTSQSSQITQSVSSPRAPLLTPHNTNNTITKAPKPNGRLARHIFSFGQNPQEKLPKLTILAILPEEHAPQIIRILRDAQSKWEVSGHSSFLPGSVGGSVRAPDIPLQINSEPANNDTESLLGNVCEWIAVHRPTLVLSLLDQKRNFYVQLVANSSDIPFVSLTQNYRSEVNSLLDDHRLEVDFRATLSSLFDRPEHRAQHWRTSVDDDLIALTSENVWDAQNQQDKFEQRLSLDPPIQTLADATFELLRSQFWFDAILIVDDSTLSDLFARRLRTLCRNNEEFDDAHRRQDRSRIDQSPYGYDESLIGMKNAHKQGRSRFLTLAEEYDFEFSDLDKIRNREIKKTQKRKSREASLLNVWKNLVIIRVSRSMPHKEFYLRMSEIQTTHRRVVLVHADLKTTERVVQTGRELDILSGAKIWMILDGLLEGAGGQLFSPELSTLSLPNGMLAMRSKRRALFDARLLESVVELAGKAALNHHRNRVAWKRLTATSSAFASSSAALSSSSPFSQHRHPSSSSSTLSSPPSYSSSLSSASSSSFLNSPLSASKCSSSNSSKDERFYRYSILSEMRKLSEPVLSRYRWTRRKPCGLFTGDSSSAPSQEVKAQNAAGLADDELENLIGESSLYRWIVPDFEVLNLVPAPRDTGGGLSTSVWRSVGNISLTETTIATIQYIGSDRVPDYVLYDRSNSEPANVTKAPMTGFEGVASFRPDMYMTNSGKHRFRVVTNIAPPFVIESTRLDNQTCLTGELCLKVETNQRDELIAIFTDFRSSHRVWEGKKYEVHCCAGIAIDLLNEISRDLHFDYDLYMVSDGLFGVNRNGWDGVTGDIVNDLAHLSFTAFSTTSSRVQAIDFSVPYFYSGVSCLAINSELTDVPLLAFLVPFSYELWAAIFASLFATAVAAAIYEWFSPFGLNPWGRQRTKNFSLASALWVMCSLLFSHLVAFKAPKSWPNKVLINVWGAFSVIFLATYTANIAAHFAGLFLEPEVNDFHDSSLMKRRTGTARSSASEGYLMEKYVELYRHSQRYKVDSFEQGLEELRTGKLEVLIGDTAILDYFRASDPNCNLRLLGDSIFDDAYAVGMQKGFPFRESISNLILKYNEYGFLDQLHRKWYGRVHCLDSSSLTKPKPLTVRAEAGVFLMLAVGIGIGVVILVLEHLVFKYILPALRKKNKDCFWKSPNLMFFSQKLYRFINTVELVSPHHSAKEIITNLREGQIASLFQKSVKRKAKEEARRRKSKSQFFEMIQEVRKVVQRQQQERSLQENEDDAENAPDNDEAGAFEIDEEVALNTESNVRLTKPSFSHQLPASDQNSKQNRASAIRFCKEPEIYGDPKKKITKNGKPTGNHCNIVQNRKLISNLKPRPKLSQSISNEDETTIGTSVDLPPLPPPPQARSSVHHLGSSAETRQRREMLKRSHLASNSFSLENIFFEGLLSEGVPHPKGRTEAKSARRILSFEDLSAIKKELSESSQESGEFGDEEPNTMVLLDYSSPSPSMGRSMVRSETDPLVMPSRQTSQQSQASARPYSSSLSYMERIGNRHLSHLSRDDILLLWRSSERELLGRLEATQQQNRALADEIAHLKQMARKPP